jgi:hypothetical protein
MTSRLAYRNIGIFVLFAAMALTGFFLDDGFFRWVELGLVAFFCFWAIVSLSSAVGLGRDEGRRQGP